MHVECDRPRHIRPPPGSTIWLPERMPKARHGMCVARPEDPCRSDHLGYSPVAIGGAGLCRKALQIGRRTHGAHGGIMRFGGPSLEARRRLVSGSGHTPSAFNAAQAGTRTDEV